MNTEKLFNIIETTNIAGIGQIILQKEDDHVLVRGLDTPDQDISIVLFSKTDKDVIDKTCGIHRVPVLLSRMTLMNLDKTKVSTEENDDFLKSIHMKEKNKRISYSFAEPNTIRAPKNVVNDEIVNRVILKKDDVVNITKAVSAFNPVHFVLSGEGNDIVLKLVDDVSDAFTDVVGKNVTGDWSNKWRTDSVMRLVKHSIKNNDDVELGIGKDGILFIEVNSLMFMVLPRTS